MLDLQAELQKEAILLCLFFLVIQWTELISPTDKLIPKENSPQGYSCIKASFCYNKFLSVMEVFNS